MNTNTGLVQYKEMMKITTFSKKEYFFPKEKVGQLSEALESKKFINLQGSIVNISSIDTIDPVGTSGDFIEDRLRGLDIDQKRKVKEQIKARKSKVHTELTPGTLENIIKSIK